MRVRNIWGKRYIYVIVDDYFRVTWIFICSCKRNDFDVFFIFVKKIEKKQGNYLVSIKSDYGTKFENDRFSEFCSTHEIDHNFSPPRKSAK